LNTAFYGYCRQRNFPSAEGAGQHSARGALAAAGGGAGGHPGAAGAAGAEGAGEHGTWGAVAAAECGTERGDRAAAGGVCSGGDRPGGGGVELGVSRVVRLRGWAEMPGFLFKRYHWVERGRDGQDN
jgi:hypothetical protein